MKTNLIELPSEQLARRFETAKGNDQFIALLRHEMNRGEDFQDGVCLGVLEMLWQREKTIRELQSDAERLRQVKALKWKYEQMAAQLDIVELKPMADWMRELVALLSAEPETPTP